MFMMNKYPKLDANIRILSNKYSKIVFFLNFYSVWGIRFL
ncbi:hypothetical protein BFO_1817 [Tannerella forsythia 92A2]|uniref:Uncharacterized protein n=1 Tax=Tannerella forsythia (strain ATCC 43037 / JCM 10827 / CCUG 21028 A / KCTC 5666 / FDC 338) TaxID=203275 RepID=G8UNP6_TANFA|nr:hypothetical protein BFO_1817 [Tannerella forsythia 92A2]BAR49168.1 hypothetical protein TF3313_1664 [Tannerella forsythia 3313]